ncbi:MAG: hypothetical protein IIV06_05325, partial [Alistipes sp.]|nr:hypothetical protein [Alistipes sp.]
QCAVHVEECGAKWGGVVAHGGFYFVLCAKVMLFAEISPLGFAVLRIIPIFIRSLYGKNRNT